MPSAEAWSVWELVEQVIYSLSLRVSLSCHFFSHDTSTSVFDHSSPVIVALPSPNSVNASDPGSRSPSLDHVSFSVSLSSFISLPDPAFVWGTWDAVSFTQDLPQSFVHWEKNLFSLPRGSLNYPGCFKPSIALKAASCLVVLLMQHLPSKPKSISIIYLCVYLCSLRGCLISYI